MRESEQLAFSLERKPFLDDAGTLKLPLQLQVVVWTRRKTLPVPSCSSFEDERETCDWL